MNKLKIIENQKKNNEISFSLSRSLSFNNFMLAHLAVSGSLYNSLWQLSTISIRMTAGQNRE